MLQLTTYNANHALCEGLLLVETNGIAEASRNGPVTTVPQPVLIEHRNPIARVLSGKVRDANPFFHLFEGLWMLAGRNDVAFVNQFNSNMKTFSDDGEVFHGAYGFRWRHHWYRDQLAVIADLLNKDPGSRRAVLTMWSPDMDLWSPGGVSWGKDVPCNTQAYFRIIDGKLNMTVTNRSNDAVWGAFGANYVQFSMLLEYMAAMTNTLVDSYYQFTNNLHIYTDVFSPEKVADMVFEADVEDHYRRHASVSPMLDNLNSWQNFDADLEELFNGMVGGFRTDFFESVVGPMMQAWLLYKQGDLDAAIYSLDNSNADWLLQGRYWLRRRAAGRASAPPAPTLAPSASAPPASAQGPQ